MARSSDSDKTVAWRRRFRRFGRSGLTVAQFSEEEGVSAASFYRWRNRLAGQKVPIRNTKARRATPKRGAGHVPAFQAVRVTSVGTPMSIHLPGGVRVEVPTENLEALRAVVGELAERSVSWDYGDVSC